MDPSDGTRDQLRTLLLGIESVWLEVECARYEFFFDVIRESNPDVAIISLDADQSKALQLIAQLNNDKPDLTILAVSAKNDGQAILQALRNGAREFLTAPVVLEEMLLALRAFSATPAAEQNQAQSLTAAEYDPAEVAFRALIEADAPRLIFHVTYGTNNSALPAEFMHRFEEQPQTIRTGLEGLTVVSNKLVLDKATQREAIGLGMRELRVFGKTAEAHLVFLAGSKSIAWRVLLVEEHGKWRVAGKQREWELCG